ncbi:hypothetical protein AHAS_Ahas05G0034000 [Arachis hypogaea]
MNNNERKDEDMEEKIHGPKNVDMDKEESENMRKTTNDAGEIHNQPPKISYKDCLVADALDNLNPKEIVDLVTEDYLSNKEFMDPVEDILTPFNPKPKLDVTLEKYDKWCRP